MTLKEALKAMPKSADKIASLLIENRCYGTRRDPEKCPLARYLSRQVGEPVCVGVNQAYLEWKRGIILPPAVSRLRGLFDDGNSLKSIAKSGGRK